MDVKVMIHLTREDVHEQIPYQLICETTSSARWNTGRVRRAFCATFTEKERDALRKLRASAHMWALVKGVPDDGVVMSSNTLSLWMRFGEFCGSV